MRYDDKPFAAAILHASAVPCVLRQGLSKSPGTQQNSSATFPVDAVRFCGASHRLLSSAPPVLNAKIVLSYLGPDLLTSVMSFCLERLSFPHLAARIADHSVLTTQP